MAAEDSDSFKLLGSGHLMAKFQNLNKWPVGERLKTKCDSDPTPSVERTLPWIKPYLSFELQTDSRVQSSSGSCFNPSETSPKNGRTDHTSQG